MTLLWFQRNPLPTDWGQQRTVVAKLDHCPPADLSPLPGVFVVFLIAVRVVDGW
jgi:hypothetical protein